MDKRPHYSEKRDFGDFVFLVALIPFCLWLGAWGILPAFILGWIVNIIGGVGDE